MKARRLARITWSRLLKWERCEHAKEFVAVNGCPYALVSTSKGHKVERILPNRTHPIGIGCINQLSELPVIAWYPEGDWFSVTSTKKVRIKVS